MDLAFRERTLSLLSGNDSMAEVRALLRLAASAAVESICSASTPFLLFADLVNTKPIAEAEANFQFLEETIKALKDVRMALSSSLYICLNDPTLKQIIAVPCC